MLVKLEWLGYRMVEKLWRYIEPFSYNTSVSRTDRQTDGRKDGRTDGRTELVYQYRASAAGCWRAIKSMCVGMAIAGPITTCHPLTILNDYLAAAETAATNHENYDPRSHFHPLPSSSLSFSLLVCSCMPQSHLNFHVYLKLSLLLSYCCFAITTCIIKWGLDQ